MELVQQVWSESRGEYLSEEDDYIDFLLTWWPPGDNMDDAPPDVPEGKSFQ